MPPTGYRRWRDAPLPVRFWAHVVLLNDCWEWTGSLNHGGYGIIILHGRRVRAHRVGFELQVGPVPTELYVLHKCDNRRCVRGSHLFLGTHSDNMHDLATKHRWSLANRTIMRGSMNGHAKLTEAQVIVIRRRLACGESRKSIAGDFGVHKDTVWLIGRRKIWNHVP